MTTLCTTLQTILINAVLRATDMVAPTSVKIALFTQDPTDSGDFTHEVSDAGYARQTCAFDAPASGITQNTSDVVFGPLTTGGVAITHFGIVRPSGSTMLIHGALSAAKTPGPGDYLKFLAGALIVQFR